MATPSTARNILYNNRKILTSHLQLWHVWYIIISFTLLSLILYHQISDLILLLSVSSSSRQPDIFIGSFACLSIASLLVPFSVLCLVYTPSNLATSGTLLGKIVNFDDPQTNDGSTMKQIRSPKCDKTISWWNVLYYQCWPIYSLLHQLSAFLLLFPRSLISAYFLQLGYLPDGNIWNFNCHIKESLPAGNYNNISTNIGNNSKYQIDDIEFFTVLPPLEVINWCVSMLAMAIVYPYIFWLTNRFFSFFLSFYFLVISSYQVSCFVGFQVVYTIQAPFLDINNFILSPLLTLILYILGTVSLFLSSYILVSFGFHLYLKASQYIPRNNWKFLYPREKLTHHSKDFYYHAYALISTLVIYAIRTPILLDLVKIYSLGKSSAMIVVLIFDGSYFVLWLSLWLLLTFKGNWNFQFSTPKGTILIVYSRHILTGTSPYSSNGNTSSLLLKQSAVQKNSDSNSSNLTSPDSGIFSFTNSKRFYSSKNNDSKSKEISRGTYLYTSSNQWVKSNGNANYNMEAHDNFFNQDNKEQCLAGNEKKYDRNYQIHDNGYLMHNPMNENDMLNVKNYTRQNYYDSNSNNQNTQQVPNNKFQFYSPPVLVETPKRLPPEPPKRDASLRKRYPAASFQVPDYVTGNRNNIDVFNEYKNAFNNDINDDGFQRFISDDFLPEITYHPPYQHEDLNALRNPNENSKSENASNRKVDTLRGTSYFNKLCVVSDDEYSEGSEAQFSNDDINGSFERYYHKKIKSESDAFFQSNNPYRYNEDRLLRDASNQNNGKNNQKYYFTSYSNVNPNVEHNCNISEGHIYNNEDLHKQQWCIDSSQVPLDKGFHFKTMNESGYSRNKFEKQNSNLLYREQPNIQGHSDINAPKYNRDNEYNDETLQIREAMGKERTSTKFPYYRKNQDEGFSENIINAKTFHPSDLNSNGRNFSIGHSPYCNLHILRQFGYEGNPFETIQLESDFPENVPTYTEV